MRGGAGGFFFLTLFLSSFLLLGNASANKNLGVVGSTRNVYKYVNKGFPKLYLQIHLRRSSAARLKYSLG